MNAIVRKIFRRSTIDELRAKLERFERKRAKVEVEIAEIDAERASVAPAAADDDEDAQRTLDRLSAGRITRHIEIGNLELAISRVRALIAEEEEIERVAARRRAVEAHQAIEARRQARIERIEGWVRAGAPDLTALIADNDELRLSFHRLVKVDPKGPINPVHAIEAGMTDRRLADFLFQLGVRGMLNAAPFSSMGPMKGTFAEEEAEAQRTYHIEE